MTTQPLTLTEALEANLSLWEAVCQGRSINQNDRKQGFSGSMLTVERPVNRLASLLAMPRLAPFQAKISQSGQALGPWRNPSQKAAVPE